jgi:hypothetical protein
VNGAAREFSTYRAARIRIPRFTTDAPARLPR